MRSRTGAILSDDSLLKNVTPAEAKIIFFPQEIRMRLTPEKLIDLELAS